MRAGFLSLLIVLLLSTFAHADVTVAADGSGDVRTVQAAIDKVPANNKRRFVIRIKAGTYVEQVVQQRRRLPPWVAV